MRKQGALHMPPCETENKRGHIMQSLVSLSAEARAEQDRGRWPSYVGMLQKVFSAHWD